MPEYSLSSDFNNKLNRDQLFDIISTNTLFTATLTQILIAGDVVNIVFDQGLTTDEQTYLNNIVSNYVYTSPNNDIKVSIIEYDSSSISIQQRYGMECFAFNAAPNTITSSTKTFKINIAVLNGQICVKDNMVGDEIRWVATPNTTVGVLMANAATGATQFTVSPTVVQNVIPGLHLTITDGVNTNECGQIIDVNTGNNTIQAEFATTNSFLAVSPTYVQITAQFVNIELGAPGFLMVAGHKIGSAALPKNYPMTCYYTNKSLDTTKRVVAYVEYLY